MKILQFEHKHFGTEDMKDILPKMGHSITVISTELIYERISDEFDALFEQAIQMDTYDYVFTFNYSVIVSQNCNRHNIKYIAWVYDSPLISLYSYTITNPCNYIFLFDSYQYNKLKNGGIDTVYYMPLAVNTDRLDHMVCTDAIHKAYDSDVSFVGAMYNEKHNLFERLSDISPYARGYINAIMEAQLKVYGCNFIESLLTPDILGELSKAAQYKPHRDGIETPAYIYANCFIARKMAQTERCRLLKAVSDRFDTKLYTHKPTPELDKIHNMGPVDFYDHMPYIFKSSKINLNITLRSIKNGIPLRCMDIMGAGGFLLSNYQTDFMYHFTPDEDFVYFESEEDLVNKCFYYLEHEDKRILIAKNGYEKVKEHHSYQKRLEEIFEIASM